MTDIKFNQLIEFLENHYETKLYNYQKVMLKAIVEGNTISVPRHAVEKCY